MKLARRSFFQAIGAVLLGRLLARKSPPPPESVQVFVNGVPVTLGDSIPVETLFSSMMSEAVSRAIDEQEIVHTLGWNPTKPGYALSDDIRGERIEFIVIDEVMPYQALSAEQQAALREWFERAIA